MYRYVLFLFLGIRGGFASAQVSPVPFHEGFDSAIVPVLPPGWSTSANRSPAGDFSVTSSTPFSGANAALSTNATIAQYLVTPPLSFTAFSGAELTFRERRSSTHNSGVVIEASIDGGSSYSFRAADTLKNPGTASYAERVVALPSGLDDQPRVFLRWRILGDGTGTSGTFRIDDVTVTGIARTNAAIPWASISPPSPAEGDSAILKARIQNKGYGTLAEIPVEFYVAQKTDSSAPPVLILATVVGPVAPGDSVDAQCTLNFLQAGREDFHILCAADGDQVRGNDTLHYQIDIGYPRNSMVINEIMYDPAAGTPEYVELLNRTTAPIDIAEWKFSDIIDTSHAQNGRTLSADVMNIAPGGFVVVASDSSIFTAYATLASGSSRVIVRRSGLSLNNSGDHIMLYDRTMHTVDSVAYLPTWHNTMLDEVKGKSLERISADLGSNDRRNWSTSADPSGGTPGRRNSLVIDSHPPPGSLTFTPNPFSPDGDGMEDVLLVSYDAPVTADIVRARIFDSIGRPFRVLADGEPSGPHGELIWDGMNDKGERVRMGLYVLLIELSDGASVYVLKGVVVVAARM